MNLAYKYVADAVVLNFFCSCSQRDRRELIRIFESLGKSPHQPGAWIRRMVSTHDLSIKKFGRWLVTYWPDDPVREIRIVSVEKLTA